MDTKKVGVFLKKLRKDNNMTQEQLGEKVGVTNKTISRWETGNYMPPVECLEILSDLYQVSINEILAGERIPKEEFYVIAETNITDALLERERENKVFEKKMILILMITSILAIVILLLLPLKSLIDAIIFVLVIALAFIANTLNIVAMAAKFKNE